MKRLSFIFMALVAAAIFTSRPASAQFVVSDPETEFETYMTAYQTAQQYYEQIQQFQTQLNQYAQQLKDGQLINQGDYTNFVGDFQHVVNSLQTGAGDTNQTSVNNANLFGDYNQTYGAYTPENGDPGESEFSQMIGNRLNGVLQALQANQAAFERANNNASVPDQLSAASGSDSGVDSLLQTNNAILIEVLKDLNYEQASNAINMQALLASTAGDAEVSAQDRSEFSTFLQNQVNAYSNQQSLAF
jgi:P-type conjugative transfer protein TrbJ